MKELNNGQKQAADAFFSMLFHDDIREMAISGGAGKGKTFLMGHLINEVMPQYLNTCKLTGAKPKYNSVVMTATTNKAAEVLGLNTGRPTSTVHSFFNLTVFENYRTGELELKKTKRWTVHRNMIIFIDEAYFMDSHLRNMILEGTANCKIIYVGDADQMAPVKERMCPVADPVNAIPTVYLTEPMRNANNPNLVALCDQLKLEVTTKKFLDIVVDNKSIFHLSDEEAEQLTQILSNLSFLSDAENLGTSHAIESILPEQFAEVKRNRIAQIEKIEHEVHSRLTYEIN